MMFGYEINWRITESWFPPEESTSKRKSVIMSLNYIKMRKVTVKIEKGKDFYSAYEPEGFKDHAINGQGKTVAKAIEDFELAFKEMKEIYLEDKEPIPEELLNIEFEYKYDEYQ